MMVMGVLVLQAPCAPALADPAAEPLETGHCCREMGVEGGAALETVGGCAALGAALHGVVDGRIELC
jgi:hypothetical protein